MIQIYTCAKCFCQNFLLAVLTVLFFLPSFAQPVIGFTSVINSTVPAGGALSSPIDIVNAGDGTNRLFVVQQGGIIKVFNQSPMSYIGNFLTVTGISSGGERGLLSMAFHPDYKNNGYFFVYYTNTSGDIELARYHTPSGTPNTADPASKQVLLTIPHPGQNNHNGGKLNFGADGYLYFATGDGGGGDDLPNNAQTGTSLLGKMLRINVGVIEPASYSIPADNPFLVPGDGINDEIWALGLRNPFRWSFDRQTHDMWIGDVGQGAWEEINFRANGSTGGINYGWHCMEGTHVNPNPSIVCTVPGVYAPPVLDYPHNNSQGGFAVIGGYVYRGSLYPVMAGHYIFADNISDNVWLLPPGGAAADTIEFRNALANISAFGEGENAELFVTTLDGQVFSVTASGSSALPVTLTGFSGTAKAGYNELNWQANNELHFKQFEVEYSDDGLHYMQAGIVAAANSGNYNYKHSIASDKKLYYRLKMVDIDGKFEYSKVIIIAPLSASNKNFVTPSIVSNGQITVALSETYSNLQVISMEGKTIYNESITGRTGKITVQLSFAKAGQYLVRLVGNGKQLTQKILVQ